MSQSKTWESVGVENVELGDVVALDGSVRVVVGRKLNGDWITEDGDGQTLVVTGEPTLLRLIGGWS